MREILFRGKRLDNGNWIYGTVVYPHSIKNENYVAIVPIIDGESVYSMIRKVIPETVGQHTGRKDKNGKEVFEHDILRLYTIWADGTVEKGMKVVVRWSDNDQCYVLTTMDGLLCDDFGNLGRPEYYEVIGNIHDNPELLGGEG